MYVLPIWQLMERGRLKTRFEKGFQTAWTDESAPII